MKIKADLVLTKKDFGTASYYIVGDQVIIIEKYVNNLRHLSESYTSSMENFMDEVQEKLKSGWTIVSTSANFDLSKIIDNPK